MEQTRSSHAGATDTSDQAAGCLIGQAIGDMMGLPHEGQSSRRIKQLGRLGRLGQLIGFGLSSDDTEHAGLTADAIQYAQLDPERFEKRLASNLRRWLLTGPPGIGLATLRACVKLCIGFSSARAGVYSAGNGPAMRAAILGVLVPAEQLREFVRRSTRLTHIDPRAELGSYCIAKLAADARAINLSDGSRWIEQFILSIGQSPNHEPFTRNLQLAAEGLTQGRSLAEFTQQMTGKPEISGFIAHTVPAVVFAFFRHGDSYEQAITAIIECGGDTDTTAAILGGVLGSRQGIKGIPATWQQWYSDWPWTLSRLKSQMRPPLWLWPFQLFRNLLFGLLAIIRIGLRLVWFI